MSYVKVTDGAVTRYFDMSNPKSKRTYNELVKNNTGFNTVVTAQGTAKELNLQQVTEDIEAAREASKKRERKNVISANRAVVEDD